MGNVGADAEVKPMDVTHQAAGPVCCSGAKSKISKILPRILRETIIPAFMFIRALNYYLNVQLSKIKEAISVTCAIKSTCAYGVLLISDRVNGFGIVYLAKLHGRDDFANSQITA